MTQQGFVLKDISKRFQNREVLSNISCTIARDRNLAITGASGCGKSTLLRILSGIETPDEGALYLDERAASINGKVIIPPERRGIAMVFQDLALWPNLTAEENVLLALSGMEERRKKVKESLETCGIGHLASKYPGEMSGGEQQRLALARAIAVRPSFLFLDEPFSGLDIAIKNSVIESIKGLTSDYDITIILVSHDPYEILSLCGSIIVLEDGRIAETGDVKKLFAHPGSEVMRNFSAYIERLRITL